MSYYTDLTGKEKITVGFHLGGGTPVYSEDGDSEPFRCFVYTRATTHGEQTIEVVSDESISPFEATCDTCPGCVDC